MNFYVVLCKPLVFRRNKESHRLACGYVKETGETKMYLYIENNECNNEDVYFTIYDGEKKLFYSQTISPYEYVKKISSNRYYTSESDIPLTVKYYSSEDNSLLGSQEIILHIVKDLDKALEDYKLK